MLFLTTAASLTWLTYAPAPQGVVATTSNAGGAGHTSAACGTLAPIEPRTAAKTPFSWSTGSGIASPTSLRAHKIAAQLWVHKQCHNVFAAVRILAWCLLAPDSRSLRRLVMLNSTVWKMAEVKRRSRARARVAVHPGWPSISEPRRPQHDENTGNSGVLTPRRLLTDDSRMQGQAVKRF